MNLENKLEGCYEKFTKIFENTFTNSLDAHALRKTKFLRNNHKHQVDKNVYKAIIKRSNLKNKSNRTKLQGEIPKYKKQRNLVVKLNSAS